MLSIQFLNSRGWPLYIADCIWTNSDVIGNIRSLAMGAQIMNNVRIRSVSIPMTIAKIAICEIGNSEKGQNLSTIQFLAWLIRGCALYLVQFQVKWLNVRTLTSKLNFKKTKNKNCSNEALNRLENKITIQTFVDQRHHQGKTILICTRPRRINGWTRLPSRLRWYIRQLKHSFVEHSC